MSSSDQAQLIRLVKDYKMPTSARQLLADHPPLIVCGITAAGKDAVSAQTIQLGDYQGVVSHTTRPPRHNKGKQETDGVSYHFVNDAQIAELIKQDQFIEVKEVHRRFYGTTIDAYRQPLADGKKPALVIDVQGAEELVATVPSLRPIFVLPPDFATWHQRLMNRGDIALADYANRLQSAVKEIDIVHQNPAFQLVVNDDVSAAAQAIQAGQADRAAPKLALMNQLQSSIKEELKKLG
jgi:guanylate kinase